MTARLLIAQLLESDEDPFQRKLDASDVAPDVRFFVGGGKCRISTGDWHSEEQAQEAVALANEHFGAHSVECDSEVGKPGWCEVEYRKRKVEEAAQLIESLLDPEPQPPPCPQCGNTPHGWVRSLKGNVRCAPCDLIYTDPYYGRPPQGKGPVHASTGVPWHPKGAILGKGPEHLTRHLTRE